MSKILRAGILAGVLLSLVTSPAYAVLTFNQLDENTFTVSHRVKGFGSRGKATTLVYTKAASLCVAAGYTHYQVLDQESQASAPYQPANATLTLKFFHQDAENRTACETTADPQYVDDAREKLQEMGYVAPEPPQARPAAALVSATEPIASSATCPQGCTIEQIAAMARAGLSDEKIRAACEGGSSEDAGGTEN